MENSSINVVIAGGAGQGLATIGQLMAKALCRSGYNFLVCQKYMSRVRGGHNTFAIRVDTDEVVATCESIDVLVALNAESFALHKDALTSSSIVIAGDDIDCEDFNSVPVPFSQLASRPLFHNVVALGVLGAVLGCERSVIQQLLEEVFAKKGEAVVQSNMDVLDTSYNWVEGQVIEFTKLAASDAKKDQLMLNGNEAVALGAIAAGCNFLSFYPMSPATSVAQTLINKAVPLGLVYEQVEDEIAAVTMAIGASYAGAKAVVTTSGGGFALMVEGVSFAAVSETPLVFVVVQRPGPATGMATRTEQGDLNLVLYAGHGEFPRAVFAPATPEDCFYLTHRAFDLAEEFQTPMFVLSDQYLADSFQNVPSFDLDQLPTTVQPDLQTTQEPYKRYALTEDGVSPRLIPGFSDRLVRADSHEHDEMCKITEDGTNRVLQNSKRLRKGCGLLEECIGPDYYGAQDAELLLLCWGTTLGACLDAANGVHGKRVGVLHFKQVYPLREEQFIHYLESADLVVAVEGNATAQFSKLIAQETGFAFENFVLRFDGRPMTPEYVLAGLESFI